MARPGSSIAIIGAGQIGYAAAQAFVDRGWEVTVYARSAPVWDVWGSKLRKPLLGKTLKWSPFHIAFRPFVAGEDQVPSADVVLDTIAFDQDDVSIYDPGKIGRLITVSSASVYRDDQGRTLDEARQNGFPDFGGSISEDQPTVQAGPSTYSTRKVRMELKAKELFGDRVTILRPCAVYGPWSRHPREWWLVKRLLDGREKIPLLHPDVSRFHTTDAEDIGYAAVDLAENECGGVFNVADHECPSVAEIAQSITDLMRLEPKFVEVQRKANVGRTPWSIPAEFSVSTEKLTRTTDALLSTYPSGSPDAIEWLREVNPIDWQSAFPQLAAYPYNLFDYEAEDAYFAALK